MMLALSASKAQADTVHDYAEAFVTGSPILRQRVHDVTAEQIRLDNRITVSTHTNSFRTVRGRTLIACVLDEVAFWRDEVSANPDVELYRAIVPALATTRGMLIGISSPYRRTGLLYSKFRSHFGQNSADVLVIKAATAVLNPSIDLGMIERARADDSASASSEWDAEFRLDLSSFLDDASIEAAIEHGRPLELPPREGTRYYSFVDMSGGRHDACCISIVHKDGERLIADVVRGRQGDPAAAAREFCDLARQYRCGTITGDNYAAEWVAGAIRDCGCDYQRCQLTRSELYLAGLVYWTRGAVRIPDQPALIRELRLLERRTARSGRDSVDHGVGGSDDHANALFGALYLASRPGQRAVICAPIIVTAPLGESRFSHPGW